MTEIYLVIKIFGKSFNVLFFIASEQSATS